MDGCAIMHMSPTFVGLEGREVDYEVEFLEEEAEAEPSNVQQAKRSFQDTLDSASPGSPGSESEQAEPKQIFRFPATVFIRNFKGHKKGPSVGKVQVNCESAEEVMQTVWDYCEKFIRRETVFESFAGGDADQFTVHWNDDLNPEVGDMDKFISFQDKASKRTFKPLQLLEKPDKMQKFLNRDINVFVHIYSESVISAAMYETLRVQLIKPEERDRAGAASNQANSNLSTELKELYKLSYISSDINWSVWASYLLTKDALEREKLKLRGPPQHLIHLFQTVPSCSQNVLNHTRQDVCIAQNVNSGYKQLLDDLQADLDQLMTYAKAMQLRLTALQTMQATNTSLLADVSGSIAVSEDSFGQKLAEEVTDCLDVDHQ
ncbi:uncharacterized protein LOC135698780 [Ochlerotatus camptorhynchus]|uniref:uncharacterized protein LOC135698780 n=1 Tax=Ochlerotatus camptorhynchus TaxID=644619 RepID=UPI0031D87206